MSYEIKGMTIAVRDMKKMLNFYSTVFDIQFEEKMINDYRIYHSTWGLLDLNLCPEELAGINAIQNRHQLEIMVTDIHKYLDLSTSCGGELLGELVEDQNSLSAAVYDPDKNSLIFKQLS